MRNLHALFFIVATVSTSLCAFEDQLPPLELRGNTFLSPRSQSLNTARFLAGWQPYIYSFCNRSYGTFAITPEYTRSFRPERLADYFFGTNLLTISGSQIENRGDLDLLADYFGLSTTYQGSLYLEPVMQNMLVDFSYYGGWCAWYLYAHAPLVSATTQINWIEDIVNNGSTTQYPANYMTESAIAPPYTSFAAALQGGKSWGDVHALQFGKLCCPQRKVALSDIHVTLGYNVVMKEHGHFGLDIRASIPTGTRSQACCLFEPVVGNGHHWSVGLGFDAHGLIWEKDGEQEVNIVVDAHAAYLGNAQQRRSFDLRPNGFGSRYILAKQFDESGNYTRTSFPTINTTTLLCKVRINFQAEGAVMFAYRYCDFTFDIGYNAWLRSRERICLLERLKQDSIGLKGIQDVTIGSIPSPATQSTATLHGNNFADQLLVADPNPPMFVQPSHINVASGENPQSFTHKIFWHFQYNKNLAAECRNKFYIGTGGEVEFEGYRPKVDFQPNHIAMSQWGLWVKGGWAY